MSADLRARLKWLMLARAGLATTLGAGLVLLQSWVSAPEIWGAWLSAIGPVLLSSYLLNFISWPLLNSPRVPLILLSYIHLLVDVLTSALVIWHTGKLESPASFLLPVCVLFGASLFERNGAWVSAILSVGAVFVISILEGAQIDFTRLTDAPETLRLLVSSALTQVAVICFVATLAAHLSERLKTTHLRLQVADKDLKTLRRLNERLLTRSQSGVLHLDLSGRVLFMNPSAARLLDIESSELLSRSIFIEAPWLMPEQAGQLDLGKAHYWERDRDDQIALACALSPIEVIDDEESGTALLLQDITHAKRIRGEEQRRAHLASIGELAAQVAHELRNPLASMRSSLQLLERMSSSEQTQTTHETQVKLLSILDRETARLAELTQSFLNVARPPEPHPYLIPLAPVLADLCELTSHSPYMTRLEHPSHMLQGITVWVDPDHLRQVLFNLIKNAHESYGKLSIDEDQREGGEGESHHPPPELCLEATLRVERQEGYVHISVLDQGEGIPIDPEPLFTPFMTTKERGSGLGLALSRALAESNGGLLTARARSTGGAQFRLSLHADPPARDAVKPRSDTLIQVLEHD